MPAGVCGRRGRVPRVGGERAATAEHGPPHALQLAPCAARSPHADLSRRLLPPATPHLLPSSLPPSRHSTPSLFLLVPQLRQGGEELRAFVQQRRPNVPLSAYGAEAMDKAEALTELNIGLAIETVAELAEVEISGTAGSAGSAGPSSSGLARAEACTHYARAAGLDSSGSYVFMLWGAAAARDASLESAAARRAAAAHVYSRGVDAGHWAVAEQRPVTLVRGLTASAWHEPQASAVCRALEAAFTQIREEALSLLEQDARERLFSSHRSKALEAGDWCDVGLYYNGMRNEQNAVRAPLTSALLCSADGEFRRDCTSCPLGSAYFSLLRPHTRLAAHCGPTNARLRAHLGLVVPEGDCEMIVGGEARRWVEGKVLLFDDSFEHEVHNETDEARLILLIDLWHPELQTDEQRMAVPPRDTNRSPRPCPRPHLCPRPRPRPRPHPLSPDQVLSHEEQRERYRGVVERGCYETTTLRGH